MADADAQAVEILGAAQRADGVAQAVMATVATAGLVARHARGQVELIVSDQQLVRCQLEELTKRSHGAAAAVHESSGLEQVELMIPQANTRIAAEKLLFRAQAVAGVSQQGVEQPSAGVVPGGCVLGAGVGKPDDGFDLTHL